jgi:imidazolonepropionase-like amidohydrolase
MRRWEEITMQKLIKAGLFIDGSGSPARKDVCVLIEDGKVAAVADHLDAPEGCETLDFSQKTVMPGMINCHVHIGSPAVGDSDALTRDWTDVEHHLEAIKTLETYIRSGVTYVRSLGTSHYMDIQFRDAGRKGDYPWPGVAAAGPLICMTGGHGWRGGREVDGADEARRAARDVIKAGADFVKFAATGGVMTPGVEPGSPQLTFDEMRALCEEATKAGKRSATHAQGSTGIMDAVNAGVTSVEHGIFLTDAIVERMASLDTWLVPTLAAPYNIVKHGLAGGIPDYMVRKANSIIGGHNISFKMALKGGVNIAMGTDAGTPFNEHSESWFELKLMIEDGMRPMDAIVSATRNAARLLDIETDYGTLEPRKYADFIVLDGNPLENVETLSAVRATYRHGACLFSRG